jgi:hypothetical protein
MVGKPNLPSDADWRPALKGAAVEDPGLTALDEERQASMADEGGAAGAAVEADATGFPEVASAPPRRRPWFPVAIGLSVSAIVIGLIVGRMRTGARP